MSNHLSRRRPFPIHAALVRGRRLMGHLWQTAKRWFLANSFAPEWLPPKWRYLAVGYLAGLVTHAIVVGAALLLNQIVPRFLDEPLLTLLAIVAMALIWGVGPSLLVALIGAAVAYYFLLSSNVTSVPGIQVDTVALLLVGTVISILVSQLQRSRTSAEHQASQLQATLHAMTDAVLVYGPTGYLRQTNAAAHLVLGLAADDGHASHALSEQWLSLTPRDEHGRPLPLDELPPSRVLRGETLAGATTTDLIIRALDGREVQLEITGEPIRDAEGGIVGGVCVCRDVTERRRLERRTRDALGALLAMAETLVLPTAEPSGATTEVPASAGRGQPANSEGGAPANRLAELMLTALGCHRVGMFAVEPETADLRPLAAAGAGTADERQRWITPPAGTRLTDAPYAEIAARLRAGAVLVLDLSRPPLADVPNPDGLRLLLVAPMRVGEQLLGILYLDYGGADHQYTPDEMALAGAVAQLGALIIERERLLRQREEARANELALRQVNQRMDDFLNIVAHELRTPLTSLMGNIQLLARRLTDSVLEQGQTDDIARIVAKARSLVERSDQSVRRLSRLVDDIVENSRIHTGSLGLRLEPCDLTVIVQEVVEEQRMLGADRTIDLKLPEAVAVPVVADPMRIGQVVTNYLDNALKYSREDQPVEVCLRVEDDLARVSVHDEGIGVPTDEQARIWDRFHRGDGVIVQSGSGIGLGIGLHVCQSIIEGHHGQIGVHSVPGQGSTFWFTLPLARSAPSSERRDVARAV
jgi:signal transduction histidine kinase/PAS domain-containing protein